MTLSIRLAWRNIWRNRRRTWLTVGAMIFSNLILIFMVSMQLGVYQLMIGNTLAAFTGHLQVQHRGYLEEPKMRSTLPNIDELATNLRQQLGSDAISARAAAFVLASSEQRSFGLQVVGVQPKTEPLVSTLPGLVEQGSYFSDTDTDEILIGSVLARNLQVNAGDEITLLGSGVDGSFAAAVVRVVGIFNSGIVDIDRSMAQLPLAFFQSVFGMDSQGHSIVVAVPGLLQVSKWMDDINGAIENYPELVVHDWEALLPGLKQAIQADLSGAWFIYSVLIVLIAFSVLNTQLMTVLERTREFGTMLALGVSPGKLAKLVMTETALLSGLGLLLGLVVGFLVTLYFHYSGIVLSGAEEMTLRFNLPNRIHPHINGFSLLAGPLVIFFFSLLAALYPALRLFLLQPVPAMRAA